MKIYLPKLGDIEIISVAGRKTTIFVPSYGAAFDLGACTDEIVNKARHVFLSHGHLDHSAGVVEHYSTRELQNQTADYYIPADTKHLLSNLFKAALELNGDNGDTSFKSKVYGALNYMPVKLSNTLSITPFNTTHRISSCGYFSTRSKTVLRKEFVGLAQKEIMAAKEKGESISEIVSGAEFFYSGDTTMEGLLNNKPVLMEADYAVVECTYLSEEGASQKAKQNGHISLINLAAEAEELFEKTHTVILMHFSAKYKATDIYQEVTRKYPSSIAKKTICVTDAH